MMENMLRYKLILLIPLIKHCVKSVRIRSFFWSVFYRIRTEYGEIRSISPDSVWMLENTDQKKLRIWTLSTIHQKRIKSSNHVSPIFQLMYCGFKKRSWTFYAVPRPTIIFLIGYSSISVMSFSVNYYYSLI